MKLLFFAFSFFLFPLVASTPSNPAENHVPEQVTFSMIKPLAVKEKHVGEILAILEKSGFQIKALRMRKLSQKEAEEFYKEHTGKPFFGDLVSKMTSGPIVTMVLSKNNAVQDLRSTIGSTNPEKAAPGTIRALFGTNVTENAIHASDSPTSAEREIGFFFTKPELE